MTERTFEGEAISGNDDFVVTASDTFRLVQFESDEHSFSMKLSEAERLARWILKIHPFGDRKIEGAT